MTGTSPIGRTGTLFGLSRFATSRRSTTDLNPIHRFERMFDTTFEWIGRSGEERLGAMWHAGREAPQADGAGRGSGANNVPGPCRTSRPEAVRDPAGAGVVPGARGR